MQSLSTALYPATDSGYRIQWGTYGVIVKILLKFLPDDALCLLHEECFDEMRRREFIIYEDELHQSGKN